VRILSLWPLSASQLAETMKNTATERNYKIVNIRKPIGQIEEAGEIGKCGQVPHAIAVGLPLATGMPANH
jgi:hypothetical protein